MEFNRPQSIEMCYKSDANQGHRLIGVAWKAVKRR